MYTNIIGQVVSIALAKGQLSQTVTSRLASCKIIGKICASKKVDAYWLVCMHVCSIISCMNNNYCDCPVLSMVMVSFHTFHTSL